MRKKAPTETEPALTTGTQPEEVVAVAASYDDSLRYGAQTPFSDQLAFQLEGGSWQVDANHNSIIAAGNGGSKPVEARLTFFYAGGTKRYQMERTIAPDDQMWVNVGDLIRNSVPDKNGNTLPADLTTGAYQLLDLADAPAPALYEGKVVTDKTFGHATYGCMVCCGYRAVDFNVDPVATLLGATTDFTAIGYNACGSGTSNVDGYMTSWWSSNTAIMTVQPQRATGASIGSTYVNAEAPNLPARGIYDGVSCPVQDTQDTGTANVFGLYTVAYSAYIPVDHVTAPTQCVIGTQSYPKIYKGDANRGTYKVTETINLNLSSQTGAGFFQDTGETRNYSVGSPAVNGTLSSADEDGIRYDCKLWNDVGKATPAFAHDETFPYATQAQSHFSGSSTNPLEGPAPITWDMRTVIDATNPAAPTAYVNFNHTCYPAHQVKINGTLVYSFIPTDNTVTHIASCLLLGQGKIIGQTSPVSIPSH
jgi:hypothetical protein